MVKITLHILILLDILVMSTLAATSIVELSEIDGTSQNVQDNAAETYHTSTDTQPTEEYMERVLFVDPSEIQNPLINHQKYKYVINNEAACDESVFVLSLIKSAPERFKERNEIRKTWGSVKSYKGMNIVPLFIMGQYEFATAKKDSSLQNELVKESVQYGDIIQGDFIDNFKNQTYKSIMGLSWAERYCEHAQFTLATNDNTMVDPYHLVDFLLQQTLEQAQHLLYCSTFFDQGPVRKPSDKLYITKKDYPYEKFPPHCEGFAYIMSSEVSSKLLQAASSAPYLWLDDVFVTGFLPLMAEVKHMDMVNGHGYNLMQNEHVDNGITGSMFLLAKYRSLRSNWGKAWDKIEESNH